MYWASFVPALCCILLYCTALHCAVLCCTVLYCTCFHGGPVGLLLRRAPSPDASSTRRCLAKSGSHVGRGRAHGGTVAPVLKPGNRGEEYGPRRQGSGARVQATEVDTTLDMDGRTGAPSLQSWGQGYGQEGKREGVRAQERGREGGKDMGQKGREWGKGTCREQREGGKGTGREGKGRGQEYGPRREGEQCKGTENETASDGVRAGKNHPDTANHERDTLCQDERQCVPLLSAELQPTDRVQERGGWRPAGECLHTRSRFVSSATHTRAEAQCASAFSKAISQQRIECK